MMYLRAIRDGLIIAYLIGNIIPQLQARHEVAVAKYFAIYAVEYGLWSE